jgi:hypothetical protein
VLHLDRDFLSDGHDVAISRAPNAPYLMAIDQRWWIMNPAGAALTLFVEAEGRRFPVSERCGFPLDDGVTLISAWDAGYEVRVTVSGTAEWAPRRSSASGQTQPGPDAVDSVRELFRSKPRHKVILAAHLRPYFQPGAGTPMPLDRGATQRCMGLTSNTALEKALNEVCEAIWGDPRHRHELPSYLIRHKLLLARDQGLVPHKACSHRRPD